MESFIYALVDPSDHRVRYVGQSSDPHVRLQGHKSAAQTGNNRAVYEWMRALLPRIPVFVILEVVQHRRTSDNKLSLASVMEAKWLKRFRRTVLNDRAEGCVAYQDFTNSPAIVEKYYETQDSKQ